MLPHSRSSSNSSFFFVESCEAGFDLAAAPDAAVAVRVSAKNGSI